MRGPSLVAGYDDDSDAGGWGDTDFGAAEDADSPGLAAPRKVQQIAVNYARSSKQVRVVPVLKQHSWSGVPRISD